MSNPIRWSVAVMCYNERDNLSQMIMRTVSALEKIRETYEIVIIEDGSVDGTRGVAAGLAHEYPVRVYQHDVNMGIGQVLIDGYHQTEGEIVGCLPADMQFAPEDISAVMTAMADADVVHVRRANRQDPFIRKCITLFEEALVWALFGLKVRDMHWVHFYRREMIDRIVIQSRTPVVDVELLYKAQLLGARRVDMVLPHHSRRMGRSTSASIRRVTAAFWDLIRLRVSLWRGHGVTQQGMEE